MEQGRGFVLHSPDDTLGDGTMPISETVMMSTTIDVLKALAKGEGPKQAIVALGYAGWSKRQLEQELQNNSWLVTTLPDAVVFGADLADKYNIALKSLGIEIGQLSLVQGNA